MNMEKKTKLQEMVVYNFSNLDLQQVGKDNCYNCDNCNTCDTNPDGSGCNNCNNCDNCDSDGGYPEHN